MSADTGSMLEMGCTKMQYPSASKTKIALISCLPIVIVGCYIYSFGLNIPVGDQWDFASLYIKSQHDTITVGELFSQHNEHRPFFPRLIWIISAYLTQYNVNAELWINFFIAISTFCFFIWQSRKFWIYYGIKPNGWTISLISLVIFNLGQWESWLVGFQTIMYLGMSCVVSGCLLLAQHQNIFNFLVAGVLGYIATFSMANGIFYWICGILIISCYPTGMRLHRLSMWLLFALGSMWLFFNEWHTHSHLAFSVICNNIFLWGAWVFNFLGAPIFTYWYIAWLFGILSLLLYGAILLYSDKKKLTLISPYLAITLFVILSALAISSGRFVENKPSYSTISRYLTISSWYWGALFTLLPILENRFPYRRWINIIIAPPLVALMFGGAWVGYENRYLLTLPAYEATKKKEILTDSQLAYLYPEPSKAQRLLEQLKTYKLSVYAEHP